MVAVNAHPPVVTCTLQKRGGTWAVTDARRSAAAPAAVARTASVVPSSAARMYGGAPASASHVACTCAEVSGPAETATSA